MLSIFKKKKNNVHNDSDRTNNHGDNKLELKEGQMINQLFVRDTYMPSIDAFKKTLEELPVENLVEENGMWSLTIDGVMFNLHILPDILEESVYKELCHTSRIWRPTNFVPEKYNRLIVYCHGLEKQQHPLQIQLLMTYIIDGLVQCVDECYAIYWGRSLNLVSIDTFKMCVKDMEAGLLPIFVWFDFAFALIDDKPTLYISGLELVGHPDILIEIGDYDQEKILTYGLNLANYIARLTEQINDGDTVDGPGGEKIKVRVIKNGSPDKRVDVYRVGL